MQTTVTTCKDCTYWNGTEPSGTADASTNDLRYYCNELDMMTLPTDFCSFSKRKSKIKDKECKSTMTINEYQQAAMRTASGMNYENHGMLMNAALGICGEGGEVADMVKKATFQGHDLDKEHLAKELGDVAWYIAVGAQAIGYDLETILQMNVDKLKARYPDGFSADKSLHRKENDV